MVVVSRRRFLGWSAGGLALLATVTSPAAASALGPALAKGAQTAPVRPSVRWWLPLADTTDAELIAEVQALRDAGAGGIEICPFCVDGVDPATMGWATPAWSARLATIIEAADSRGLDVTLGGGPLSVAAVPMNDPRQDAGAAREVASGAVAVAPAGYSGPVPGPPPAEDSRMLLAVIAARTIGSATAKPVLLDPAGLIDLTSSASNATIDWIPPDNGAWILFGFWQRVTGQPVNSGYSAQLAAPTAPNSYFVDHYSAAGAAALTGYWDQHIPAAAGAQLLFLDSLELIAQLPWSPDLPGRFQVSRGYSITPFLPVLAIDGLHSFFPPSGATPDSPPDYDFPGDLGTRIRNDYYAVLTELYQTEYLDNLRRWAVTHGWLLRAQVAYGATLELASSATHVDIPETESLAFAENVDGYRAQAGAVHLTGASGYSAELAPVYDGSYAQTLPELVASVANAFAGGVNQVVLHGFPYASAPGASWPGWAPFDPVYSEAWGPRQPCWPHIPDVLAHITSLQTILHTGIAKVDLAVYRLSYWDHSDTVYFAHQELTSAGYRHEFLAPALLELPSATVAGGILAPDGPGYRAFLLDGCEYLPIRSARTILSFARSGLPVVIIGAVPDRTPFHSDGEDGDSVIQTLMAQLLGLPTVRNVTSGAAALDALTQLGIRPSVAYQNPVPVLSVQRVATDRTYFYLYNPTDTAVTTQATLQAAGAPYLLHTWTGAVESIPFVQTADGIQIDLRLNRYETNVVVVATGDPYGLAPSGDRIAGSRGGEIRVIERGQYLRATAPGRAEASFADGRTVCVTFDDVPGPIELADWDVIVEDWQPGPSATETTIVEHRFSVTALLPWPSISEIKEASGTATYRTTVVIDSTWNGGTGAYLDLGPVFHTMRVRLNGAALPVPDPRRPVLDLRGFLIVGSNTIEVEVSTTLLNRIRALTPASRPVAQNYGLIGPVRLIPYGESELPA